MKPTHLTDTDLEHILERNLNKRPLDRANLTVGAMRSLITEVLTQRETLHNRRKHEHEI